MRVCACEWVCACAHGKLISVSLFGRAVGEPESCGMLLYVLGFCSTLLERVKPVDAKLKFQLGKLLQVGSHPRSCPQTVECPHTANAHTPPPCHRARRAARGTCRLPLPPCADLAP